MPIQFERIRINAVEAHRKVLISESGVAPAGGTTDLGAGLALFDVDGDLDLDLFLAALGAEIGGSRACLLRNDSLPAAPQFEKTSTCDEPGSQPRGAFGTDLDNDGRHELLVTGHHMIRLLRFHPEPSQTELLDLLPEDDPRRRCNPAAAVSLDIDADGRIDLMVSCAIGPHQAGSTFSPVEPDPDSASLLNLVFLQRDEGFEVLSPGDEPPTDVLLTAANVTLSLGAADLNDDGLLDLIVSEDSEVMITDDPTADPGGIYLRCQPQEPCRYRVQYLGPITPRGGTGLAKGAYMGSGVLHHDRHGEVTYIADAPENRMVSLRGDEVTDHAIAERVDFGFLGDVHIYAWGIVVDDFDRDGSDDLFVANGDIVRGHPAASTRTMPVHFELLALQRADQPFQVHSGDLGITPPSTDDSLHETRPFAARGAAKADLDLDGHLDLLVSGLEGKNKLYREVPNLRHAHGRCTIVPVDRYVPAYGVGHALSLPGDPRWRQWDSGGQLNVGTSPFVLSPSRSGELRFPSGAVVPFECDDDHMVVVEEPDWLELSRRGGRLLVTVGDGAPEGVITVLAAPSMTELSPEDGAVQLPPGTDRVMLRFGRRWTHRWWSL